MNEALFYFGDTLKALDDGGKVGGYLVRFDTVDLTGERFTAKTYLGARDGDGVDTLFHHGQPLPIKLTGLPAAIKEEIERFQRHIFAPVKTKRDAIGIFAEAVLKLSDAFEEAVFGLVKAGKLGWSSGALGHQVIKSADGEILRWIIGEASLTPTPAEPLNRAVTLKAIEALKFVPLDDAPGTDGADDDFDEQPMSEAEKLVSGFKSLDVETHSRLVVSACRDFEARFRSRYEVRLKAGRVLSEANHQWMTSALEQWKAVTADLQSLLDESALAGNDTEKRARDTEHFMRKYRYDRQ